VTKRYDGNAQAVGLLEDLTPKNVEWRISLKEFLEK
jgi:hypothetical protein